MGESRKGMWEMVSSWLSSEENIYFFQKYLLNGWALCVVLEIK